MKTLRILLAGFVLTVLCVGQAMAWTPWDSFRDFLKNVGSSITPTKSTTYDLGTTSRAWRRIYSDDTIYANKIQLSAAGNFGIGTTLPTALLDVGGGSKTYINGTYDALFKGNVEIDSNLYVQAVAKIDTYVLLNSLSAVPQLLFNANGYGYMEMAANGQSNTATQWLNIGYGSSGTMSTVDMTIYSTGNVGIGSTVPKQRLTIGSGTPKAGQVYVDPGVYIQGTIQVDGAIYFDSLRSTTGTRYMCIDDIGTVRSSTTACSGT